MDAHDISPGEMLHAPIQMPYRMETLTLADILTMCYGIVCLLCKWGDEGEESANRVNWGLWLMPQSSGS
jgi:hypothetical protein